MARYVVRRLLYSIPTLLGISLIIFAILYFAPGDPTGQLPLTIPAEQREQIRDTLGLNEPFFEQWWSWLKVVAWNEPMHLFESVTNTCIGDCVQDSERVLSWATRSPAVDTIYERLPQTFWVLGLAFIFGTLIAIPIGIISAYRQYSAFDNIGTVISMVGFSTPTFFTGLVAIVIFSVKLKWFPSFYKTTHDVEWSSWSSIWFQIKQMIMPVTVLTFFNAATLSRFTRASMLDNLNQDYVRTARSKGLGESLVVNRHVLRNSLIPVVTLIALSIPGIFGGAIITEQVFKINGIGALLIDRIQSGDVPTVQTITFIFAVLTVGANLIADILYGWLDPRIRYD